MLIGILPKGRNRTPNSFLKPVVDMLLICCNLKEVVNLSLQTNKLILLCAYSDILAAVKLAACSCNRLLIINYATSLFK